ncbi:TPA: hypothetical protein JI054_16675 [Acinetobacter baumannii]|nr:MULTISPECIES: HIRAN domain-containing protein [Acinetobacter]EKV4086900.1 hypothetical protein [Acinetobacter baumannii]MCU4469301.1 HIRAN domain-containing protein [Acinetobacter pittii]MCU4484269.1 HIRAN domain-containing protein [Acinetobacter pittii]MDC5397355.1 HIRAN domain-containing protein [Acinetobacter baumannii]MDH2647692.1 HIRAN domain-containing protein [Acinetobacter baumannii]
MKSVYVMWQDMADTRMWHPVAKLTQQSENDYLFNYTKGATHKSFSCFPNMEDRNKVYRSETLFTFFKNRLIPESRPEHDSLFEWTGLSANSKDYIQLLAISGGEKKTDHFRIVNIPQNENGFYKTKFFVSGVNHLTDREKIHTESLKDGDRLDFEFEFDNPFDDKATLLFKDINKKVGYLPHYLCNDLRKLLDLSDKCEISINILKVNTTAPAQYRILCELKAPWKNDFRSFDDDEFKDM